MAVDIYTVERRRSAYIAFNRGYQEFRLLRNKTGYFAGTFPDGIVTIAGKPIAANIRILLRTILNGYGDGSIVATTRSNPDGTWRVNGLDPTLRYDVVARYDGENDVIMSDVTPMID